MRILISCVPFDGGRSGISVYIRNLVAALLSAGHELTLIVEPDARDLFPECRRIVLPTWTRHAALSMLYHLFILPFQIRRKDFDGCIVAAANRRFFAFLPVFTIAVVHDLSQCHVSGKYDPFRMFYVRRVLPFFVRRAHAVVAISRATADDLKQCWNIPEEKLSVVFNGVAAPPARKGEDGRNANGGSGLKGKKHILYISRLEHPGKNHATLIRAYDALPEALRNRFDLVLPGADWNGAETVHEAARRSPNAARIHLPGFVSDEERDRLMNDAACYVFPSCYEGFGLSLLEAMRDGIPCACSSTSSLGEIGAGAALLFDPGDADAIARAMEEILTNEATRTRLIAAGRERAKEYSWEKTAEGLTRIMEEGTKRNSEEAQGAPKEVEAEVFGAPIHAQTMREATETLRALARKGRETGRCAFAAFVNAHCLNMAWSDKGYLDVLKRSDVVWPDGIGVKLAGRILGFPVPENVNGTDMFPLICESGLSIWLLGAAPGVAEIAMRKAKEAHPDAVLLGADHGYFEDEEAERKAIEAINAARPDALLVAMGVPRQEKWIARHQDELQCGVAVAVGGLFDFVSGRIPRAPLWMRKSGLEWLFRLYQEPTRLFRRYVIGNPLFLARTLLWRMRKRKG